MTYELGIIGAGNMAEAIVRGILNSKLLQPSQIIAADVSEARRTQFSPLGVKTVTDNAEVAKNSSAILLSVKPQQMVELLKSVGPTMDPQTLVISIAAGISSGFIERTLGANQKWRVIRTMPNTPMLVGEGMVGLSAGANATADDVARATRLFQSAAKVVQVTEDKIDAVTAVSGSGPAYFFYMVEQMVKAGVELGLTPEQAHALATQTALGAAKMLTQSTDSPAELRRKVTSPNGTTHAAITHMESTKVGENIAQALHAAAKRSKELSA